MLSIIAASRGSWSGRRALEVQQHRLARRRQPVLILQPRDLHPRRHPAVPLPVDAHKHLALLQVRPVHGPRRVRPGARLIPHRDQVQPGDRPPRGRPLGGQLLQRRGDEHPHPLIRRQDHCRPVRRRLPARRSGRTRLLRLPHVPAPSRRRTRQCRKGHRPANREPSDLDEPHLHQAGICQRRHGNPCNCEVLISTAIITPGSATGTEVGGLRDRPCALSPNEKTSNPGKAGPIVAAGSALLERLPSDVPPAARDRLAAALIPPSGVRRRRLDHRPAQLPRDPAIEVLAWMAHALIAATRR